MTIGIDGRRPPPDVPLRCRCGHVHGTASGIAPSSGFRLVCYCKDCQAFASFLGRADVLDAAGGTDIFQMPLAHVKLTAGADAVRCVRLSTSGAYRWYAECCQTPIGNTAGSRMPMIGVIHSFMDHEASGRSRDAVLGRPRCGLFATSANGPIPPTAPPPPSPILFIRRIAKLLGWWMGGLARPTPFFDGVTGAPLSVPRVLTPTEGAALGPR